MDNEISVGRWKEGAVANRHGGGGGGCVRARVHFISYVRGVGKWCFLITTKIVGDCWPCLGPIPGLVQVIGGHA